jgi:hypothetical protein
MEDKNQRPLADRRAGQGGPVEDEEHDFAEERSPSPSDPPNATPDAPGGADEGYVPQTELGANRRSVPARGLIGRLRELVARVARGRR